MNFTVFPAIDLRHGRCVRLRQGSAEAETVFSEHPAQVAGRWQDEGATWLHLVNLDGALESPETWTGPNLVALHAILGVTRVPVQFGGGVRSLDSLERLLDLGVARVILGTIAVSQPELVAQAVSRFGPDKVVVSLDARSGLLATHGWVATSQVRAAELGIRLRSDGLATVVHTDVTRDGMLSGANITASVDLASTTGLEVIVSGGVASLEDVAESACHARDGIAGVITGQALYTGAFSLSDALRSAEAARSAQGDAHC
jgi:phosphoribosylformimino-5-aminoimidazole carboxamide ribotide isomerase